MFPGSVYMWNTQAVGTRVWDMNMTVVQMKNCLESDRSRASKRIPKQVEKDNAQEMGECLLLLGHLACHTFIQPEEAFMRWSESAGNSIEICLRERSAHLDWTHLWTETDHVVLCG